MTDWMRGTTADVGMATVQGGPFPDGVTAWITSLFGSRAPIMTEPPSAENDWQGIWTGWIENGQRVDFHWGLDLWPLGYGDGSGCPLLALGYGVVIDKVTDFGPYIGNSVRVQYEAGGHTYKVRYYHMQLPAAVTVGDLVSPGQLLGFTGETGRANGAHLHLEIMIDDYTSDPLSLLIAARDLGFIPAPVVTLEPLPEPAPVVSAQPTPDVQWVAEGWAREGGAAWQHVYPMRARTEGIEVLNIRRTGRTADGWTEFDIVVDDYVAGR